jgi:hypothetical protein
LPAPLLIHRAAIQSQSQTNAALVIMAVALYVWHKETALK